MKVRELNALLNKLGKQNQEQNILVAMPPLVWENPTPVQAKDGIYLVPKEIEDQIEQNMSREEVAQKLTEFHQAQQGGTAAA